MTAIVLRQPPGRPWGMPNMSPFCIKLETYLRVSETEHTVAAAQFSKTPRGKVPYIELDGTVVADSQHVIAELEGRAAKPLDAGLSDVDRAIGRMIRRTLEEAAYFIGVRLRWTEDAGWALFAPELKKLLPGPARLFAPPLIRGKVKKMLLAQGTGRHTLDEVSQMLVDDWAAIATILGDRPFVLGDQVRTVDCTVFGFLEAVLGFPNPNAAQQGVAAHANLVAYRKRFRDRWWKDLEPAAAAAS